MFPLPPAPLITLLSRTLLLRLRPAGVFSETQQWFAPSSLFSICQHALKPGQHTILATILGKPKRQSRRRALHLQANLPQKASSDTAPNPVKPNMQKWYLQFYNPPKKYFPLLKDAINFPSMRVFNFLKFIVLCTSISVFFVNNEFE